MTLYDVIISRGELITLRLDAADPLDADIRALRDGEEVSSRSTGQPETVEVREVPA